MTWGAEIPDTTYCSVGSDNILGGQRAASHLIRLGRRELLFLGDTEAPEADQRHRGFRKAHIDAGLVLKPDLFAPAHFDISSAEAVTQSVISRGIQFDGIIAASDLIAIGAIRALVQAGLRVPDDIPVVGYDNIPASRLVTPPLTTIDQDAVLAGRVLVSKLLDTQGGQPSSERVQTSLIVRDSCGA